MASGRLNRQHDRRTERHVDRQTDRIKDRLPDRLTERVTDRLTERVTDIQIDRLTGRRTWLDSASYPALKYDVLYFVGLATPASSGYIH